jgi:hypothetical protein
MSYKNLKFLLIVLLISIFYAVSGQNNVPYGIHYQAVARDKTGKEIINKDIEVRFSIISQNPLGTLVYQELHSDIVTSKYGVFSLIIGHGTPVSGIYGDFSQIKWSEAPHYLKVEVKFENDFLDMGTMQFLAVPYALYAQKSLEPGPVGPKGDKGDPGDPSLDNQTLSFDGNNLSIARGNIVNLSTLNVPHQLSLIGDTLSILGGNSVGLTNQIQDLQLDINNKLKITKNASATAIDLGPFKQNLAYDNASGLLSISNGSGADLSSLKTAGIQDIQLTGNHLSIDKNPSSTGVDLAKYMDNTDNQQLTYTESSKSLSISGGNSVTIGTMVAFRATKSTSESGLSYMTDYDFKAGEIVYNDGLRYNGTSGVFTASISGIYTFIIGFNATGTGDSRSIKLFLNDFLYESLNSGITATTSLTRSITMKLGPGDTVKIKINTGSSSESGTGSFSGYKVY